MSTQPPFSSDLSYGRGGQLKQVATVPGVTGGIDPAVFEDLMRRKIEASRPVGPDPRIQQMQLQAMASQMNQPRFTNHENRPAPKAHGRPVFTKAVGGAGMQGGNIRLNQWEPGAAFAGYEEDLGSGPANAAISAPGTSAASLVGRPDLNQQVSAQRLLEGSLGSEGALSPKAMQTARANSSNASLAKREDAGIAAKQAQLQAILSMIGGGAR